LIKSNAETFRCFVDNSDVPSTKEHLVDESLEETSDVSLQAQSADNPFEGEKIHLLPDTPLIKVHGHQRRLH